MLLILIISLCNWKLITIYCNISTLYGLAAENNCWTWNAGIIGSKARTKTKYKTYECLKIYLFVSGIAYRFTGYTTTGRCTTTTTTFSAYCFRLTKKTIAISFRTRIRIRTLGNKTICRWLKKRSCLTSNANC